jgi:hypothetical protein
MLLALLVLLGTIAFCLFMAWLGTKVFFPSPRAVPVRLEPVGGGIQSGVVGENTRLDSPTPEDIAAETNLAEPELQDTLKTVLDAVALHTADIDIPTESEEETTKPGGSQQIGDGTVAGYGIEGPGRPGIPPQMRWEISFADGQSLDLYARQLDFFHIELGAVGVGQVTYAENLSKRKPDVYTGPSGKEKRLYMTWRIGRLKEADRELLGRAGINAAGIPVLQFYPRETEQLLLQVEHDYDGRDVSTIRKTRFGVRSVGSGYEFYVIEQTYL